jgi:hypothetical protein
LGKGRLKCGCFFFLPRNKSRELRERRKTKSKTLCRQPGLPWSWAGPVAAVVPLVVVVERDEGAGGGRGGADRGWGTVWAA